MVCPLRHGRSIYLFLLILLLSVSACARRDGKETPGTAGTAAVTTQAATAPPTVVATAFPTAHPSAEPSSTPPPQASLTAVAGASPTPPPSPTPSSTPPPETTLYVPESWPGDREKLAAAMTDLSTATLWRLVEEAEADVRLRKDDSGMLVSRATLALAVPFSTEWHDVSSEEAARIVDEGHEVAVLVPWTEMKSDQRALRIDGFGPADSNYPLVESWSLAGEAPAGALRALARYLREESKDTVVHLAAVGDIMLDRSLGILLRQGDIAYPFAHVAGRLQEADVALGNVESALADVGEPQPKRYPFRAPVEAAAALGLAGFDVVSLANNHGMDYGADALAQAISLLQKEGVVPVGAGMNRAQAHAPHVMEVNGLQLAIYGYVHVPVEASTGFDTAVWTAGEETPGLAWADPGMIAADLAALDEEVDLVVVLLHSGFEYQPAPSEAQQEAARAAVDAGADLVIGHHAHILQGIEYYKDGVIIYGSGNFAFDIDGPPETAIFHVWLDAQGVREISIEPTFVQYGGQPRLAAAWEAPAIRHQVYRLSRLLNQD